MIELHELLPDVVTQQLTQRSLWGSIPRRTRPSPSGQPKLALTFDLDYQADTDALPWIIDLLDELGAKMTVFSIGKLVEATPEPYRQAVAAGHEIANHTFTHPDNPVLNPNQEFWDLSVDEMRLEIGRCQEVIEEQLGVICSSFRTPHFKDHSRVLQALLAFPELTCISTALASKCPVPTPYLPSASTESKDSGLHYPLKDSALIDAGVPLMVPLTPCPGMRWSPFCSYSAIREPRNPAKGAGMLDCTEWERRWVTMLDQAARRKFASVYFDPIDVARDDITKSTFTRMLVHAMECGWELTTIRDIETTWRPLVISELNGARSS